MERRKSRSSLQKRELAFIVDLFAKLLEDYQQLYPEETRHFQRDLETIKSRVCEEGVSFLTQVLPRLGKAFDQALDTGCLKVPPGLKRSKQNPAIPAFGQGMLRHLFDSEGCLVGNSISIVRDFRQLCYLVYKYQLPYQERQIQAVIDSFVATEDELSQQVLEDTDLIVGARELIEETLKGFDPQEILPRHGPGAVATGEKLEEKWEFSRLYQKIHQAYPYYDYFLVGGGRELLDRIHWYRSLDRLDVGVAKVVLVPKDSRGPRLISMEPLEHQWVQQGLGRALMDHLERNPLAGGHINFTDQEVNRCLAQESSWHGYYCTLDMKDASDRVSLQLVERLLPPRQFRYFNAVRSDATLLPDGRLVYLKKYAPMGSACCFPIEALVFWALCVVACSRALRVSYREAALGVFVFGDDIIVPTEVFAEVVEALESVNLLVNRSKCFHRGDFRESCGMDAYKGVPVTPTRISKRWSSKPSDASAFAAYAAYANSFAEKGYERLAGHLFDNLDRTYGQVPFGTVNSGYPCRALETAEAAAFANAKAGLPMRFNKDLQTFEIRVKVAKVANKESGLDGWTRFLRDLTVGPGIEPSLVAVPRTVKLVRRWRVIR